MTEEERRILINLHREVQDLKELVEFLMSHKHNGFGEVAKY